MIPVLKPVVWERDGGDLHLMADVREMRTLADPDGRVEGLLRLLSAGDRTTRELAAAMARQFPGTTPADVAEGIDGLDQLGLLEDAGRATTLTQAEQDRYFTNLVFFQSFASLTRPKEDMQRRLAAAHVLILGTGGLGSTVLMHLAGAGVGRLTLLEHDVVEERNFSRQYTYRHADIGRLKADRAAEVLCVASTLPTSRHP